MGSRVWRLLPSEADILWLQLDDILSRQDEIVVALIDRAVSNAGELRDKGQFLPRCAGQRSGGKRLSSSSFPVFGARHHNPVPVT